jgi:hypothetical protein
VLPEAAEVLLFAAAALVLAVTSIPAAVDRRRLLIQGGAGLVAGAAIALAPTFDLVLLVLCALGMIDASAAGGGSFAVRLRAPIAAVAFLGLGLVFLRVEGPDVLGRLAAVGLVAGLAAAVGLLPYIHPFGDSDGAGAASFVWTVFAGPLLGVVVVARAQSALPVDAGAAFAAMLIGVGVLNMAWGAVVSYLTTTDDAAWRYSFLADWGLVLCGFGLTLIDGRRAALLVLFGIMLGRLPLYLAARDATGQKATAERPINFVVAAALAGAAPFAGFAARVLLLRGATQLFWPLALALALLMLLWLPGSLRLGRSLGTPRRREMLVIVLVLAINIAAGLYPLPLLALARL